MTIFSSSSLIEWSSVIVVVGGISNGSKIAGLLGLPDAFHCFCLALECLCAPLTGDSNSIFVVVEEYLRWDGFLTNIFPFLS